MPIEVMLSQLINSNSTNLSHIDFYVTNFLMNLILHLLKQKQ